MDNLLYEFHDDITPEFILQRIPQEDIYQRYLGLAPEFGINFCNPLRDDRNPTCSFGIINGKLVFRDWSEHIYMDVFDIVQKRFKVGFHQALNIIASDFELKDGDVPAPVYPLPSKVCKTQKPRFDVQVQPFTNADRRYLDQFAVTPAIASRFNVFSVKSLFINGRPTYRYSDYDPAIGYYFGLNSKGHQKWKIYYYIRASHRFLCNTARLNGWIQLPNGGEVVVVTKSLKDVMSLYRLGIPATGTQGESILPSEDTIGELRLRFNHIVSLFDYDKAGIKTAATLRRDYAIPAFMLTDGRFGSVDYQSKDISDYIRDHGLEAAKKLTHHALDHLLHETASNRNYPQLSAAF